MPPNELYQPIPAKTYVLLQAGGWSLWTVLYGIIAGAYVAHTPRILIPLAVSYILAAGYGAAITHVLYLKLNRSWMRLPLPSLLLRLVPSVVGGACLIVCAIVLINDRLLSVTGGHFRSFRFLLLLVVNFVFVLTVWTTLFGLLYQVRQRRLSDKLQVATELARRRAQYRSLAAQVQPHFLFNSLNIIRALVYENPAEADRAITHLAALLRESLSAESGTEHTLARELELVQNCLALEALRFEDRLRTKLTIEQEVLQAAMPPMSLQHLVENALKHGIAHLPLGGEVAIEAKKQGSLLLVEVRNPFSATARSESASSSGLGNTRERLALLYGPAAGLVLTPENGVMIAHMFLPFEEVSLAASLAC